MSGSAGPEGSFSGVTIDMRDEKLGISQFCSVESLLSKTTSHIHSPRTMSLSSLFLEPQSCMMTSLSSTVLSLISSRTSL